MSNGNDRGQNNAWKWWLGVVIIPSLALLAFVLGGAIKMGRDEVLKCCEIARATSMLVQERTDYFRRFNELERNFHMLQRDVDKSEARVLELEKDQAVLVQQLSRLQDAMWGREPR